jgi:hypothetical protein
MDYFDSFWEMDLTDRDADTGVTTIARLFFFEESS